MIKYTTVTEVKEILGISGSSEDSVLGRYIEAAQRQLNNFLSIRGMDRRTINDEPIESYPRQNFLYIQQVPFSRFVRIEDFDQVTQETPDTITIRHLDGEFSRKLYFDASLNGFNGWKLPLTITYIAGYAPFDQLDILDYTDLAGKTVTIDTGSGAQVLTEGVDFDAETSNEVTAQNIYTAIVANAGIDDSKFDFDGSLVRVVDEGVGDFSTNANVTAASIFTADMPEDIKLVVAYLVGGMRKMKQRLGGVQSFTLGSKTVSFINASGKDVRQEAEMILESYLDRFRSINGFGI